MNLRISAIILLFAMNLMADDYDFVPDSTLNNYMNEVLDRIIDLTETNEQLSTDHDLILRAYELSDSLDHSIYRAHVHVLLSNVYKKLKNDDESLEYTFKALTIFKEAKDYQKASENLYAVGSHYFYRGEFEKSIDYISEANSILPETEEYLHLKPKIYTALGALSGSIDKLDESLAYHQKALNLKRELGLIEQIPISLSNMGHTYLGLGDTTKALNMLMRASFLGDSLSLHKDVLFAEFSIGAIHYDMGRYTESVPRLEFAVDEYEKLDTDFDLVSAYPKLAYAYTKTGNHKGANNILRKFIELKQRMFDESKTALSDELEKQYQTDQKEQENIYLKTQNDNHIRQRNIYIIGILTLLGLLGLLWRNFAQMRRVKRQLDLQKSTIQEQANELQELDNLKSRFFANVSHELRTPLSLILGPVNTLLNSEHFSDRDYSLLQFIQRNAIQLKKLVNEILDLSKLENHRLELLEEPVEVYSLLKEHITKYFIIEQKNRINIILKLDRTESDSLIIDVDTDKFLKIINNLISNAIKYNKANGLVEIGIKELEKDLEIYVRDTGKGIPAEELANVFDRYYRSSRDQYQEGGTGIGLAFSKELSQLLGGELRVESTVGVGSTFYLTIPKKVTKEVPINRVITSPVKEEYDEISTLPVLNVTKDYRDNLLIAEDNPELREYYRIILSEYNIHTVNNGREAMDYIEDTEQLPDLIISDVMMPEVDGIELLEQLKGNSTYRHIPVIMVTARTDKYIKIKALRIGLDDYLNKPFDEEEIKVRIHNLISNYRVRTDQEEGKKIGKVKSSILVNDEDAKWLEDFEKYIVDNISDPLLSVMSLSSSFMMSESSLRRQLKRLIGMSPSRYLQEHKLDKSRSLLENKIYKTVSLVAYNSGFQDAKSFSRSFKNRFGRSPSEYLND